MEHDPTLSLVFHEFVAKCPSSVCFFFRRKPGQWLFAMSHHVTRPSWCGLIRPMVSALHPHLCGLLPYSLYVTHWISSFLGLLKPATAEETYLCVKTPGSHRRRLTENGSAEVGIFHILAEEVCGKDLSLEEFLELGGLDQLESLGCEAPKIAFSWFITPITMANYGLWYL